MIDDKYGTGGFQAAVFVVGLQPTMVGWLRHTGFRSPSAHYALCYVVAGLQPALLDRLCRPFRAHIVHVRCPGVSFAALISPQAILCHRFAVRTGGAAISN